MKLIEIVNARTAMQKLVGQDLPLKEAFGLVKTVDACNVFLTFYGQEMLKLGSNPDPERMKELNEMEAEGFRPETLRICLDTVGVKLSAADVKALEPFVEFYAKQE